MPTNPEASHNLGNCKSRKDCENGKDIVKLIYPYDGNISTSNRPIRQGKALNTRFTVGWRECYSNPFHVTPVTLVLILPRVTCGAHVSVGLGVLVI